VQEYLSSPTIHSDIFVANCTCKQFRPWRIQQGRLDEYNLVMYLTQELRRYKTQTRNTTSSVVALLTELQERSLHHAVCWITQTPNVSHKPQMFPLFLHWPTTTTRKLQDQEGSRANPSTSTSTTTYRLRMTGRQDHYRNWRIQETAGEKCTAKWKITT
jgi:hypothetical protein